MSRLAACIVPLALSLTFLLTATAGADTTLGTTTEPPSATGACAAIVAQLASEPATPYSVPAGGGAITEWQTNSSADAPGSKMIFYVLRPGGTTYTVVGSDTETLPNPLPAGGILTFPLATPIVVSGGESLGVVSTTGADVCYWSSSSLADLDTLVALTPTGAGGFPFAPGTTLVPGDAATSGEMNLAATLVVAEDAQVRASSTVQAAAGEPSLLSATVTNSGPSSAPIAFTETIPAGLAIVSAAAGSGSCTVSGQQVNCTLAEAAGQTAPVDLIVVPGRPGRYTSTMAVTTAAGFPDPNAANNTASEALTADALIKPVCAVPTLRGIALAAAKRILRSLDCTLGRVHRVHSRSVARGAVTRTAPGVGMYAPGTSIVLQVSTGRPAHRRRR